MTTTTTDLPDPPIADKEAQLRALWDAEGIPRAPNRPSPGAPGTLHLLSAGSG